jgi:hypothetical protein
MNEISNQKKIKIGTYIDRCNFISDVFIQYYLNFFTHDEFHFFILDKNYDDVYSYLKSKNFNDSSFESVSNNHIGVHTLMSKQNSFVDELTSNGVIVIYVDIDEILYHIDLRNFIFQNKSNYIVPKGVVLIPNTDEEELNKNNKILNQRSYCVIDDLYHSKVTVLRENYIWSAGRHNKNNIPISDEIFLIDISKCCPQIMIENNIMSNNLYPSSTERYSITEVEKINKILNEWRTKITELPKKIRDSKLF